MSSKSSSDNESKKGGVKAKKQKSAKKSGLKSKKPAKKSSSKSKKPKSPKKKSSKRGGSHRYAQMFKSSLSPCYEDVEKTSWNGGNQFVVPPSASNAMNQELLAHQTSNVFSMDDVQTVGPAEFAATGNESHLQDARGEVSGWSPTIDSKLALVHDGSGKKKKKTSSKKKSILGKTKNFLSSLLSKTKSGVKKTANFVKSKVSSDKKKKSTKKSVKKSTKTDKKKKAKKSVKKNK